MLTEFLHICHMLIEVFEAATQSVEVFLLDVGFGHATMQFQTLCRGYYHGQFGLQSGFATLDVEKFLSTEVGTETGFSHHIVGIGKCHFGG